MRTGRKVKTAMRSDEILDIAKDYGIDPRIVARVEKAELVPSIAKRKDLPVEIQWQITVDKKWSKFFKESPSWGVKEVFKKIGFKRVKPPKKAEWEELVALGQRAMVIVLGCEVPVRVVRELPNWVTYEAVQEDKRLVANEWLCVSKLSKAGYLGLTNKEIDFMVSVHGYAFPWENWEEAVELIQKFASEEWEQAFRLWRLLGKVPSSLQPWGEGFEAFSDRVKAVVAGTPLLESLRGRTQEPESVLEMNTEQIDWSSFEEIPSILLEKQEVPKNCFITSENVELLLKPNAEFCVNYGKDGEGSNALMAFHLVEKSMEEWEEEFGQEPQKFLEYWYPWYKKDLPYYDLIVKAGLRSSLEENVNKVLQGVYGLWFAGTVDSRKSFKRFSQLWKEGILGDVCQSIRDAEWDTREGLAVIFKAFLQGETFGFPGSHWNEIDFVQTFQQAKKLGDQYGGKWKELWLSLLNGNRWVEGDKVFYETLAFRDGVWGKYVFEDGTVPDCKCVWGLGMYPQVVRVGDDVRQYCGIAIE